MTVHGAVVIPDGGEVNVAKPFVDSIFPTPILTASEAGLPQNLRYSQRTDFGPRIGFAWRVTADSKFVIRGGYGRYIQALSGSGLNSAWAVASSFVGRYTNSYVNGKHTYSFPSPFPANLAQPGTESFQLASETTLQRSEGRPVELNPGARPGLQHRHPRHLRRQPRFATWATNTTPTRSR